MPGSDPPHPHSERPLSQLLYHPYTIPFSNDPKPITIIPLIAGLDEKQIVEQCSWYHHEYITTPLFKERQLDQVQLRIGDPILLTVVELHRLRRSERNW